MCCEESRKSHAEEVGRVMLAIPQSELIGGVRCQSCGRETSPLKFMRVLPTKTQPATVIEVDNFEFDEGLVEV